VFAETRCSLSSILHFSPKLSLCGGVLFNAIYTSRCDIEGLCLVRCRRAYPHLAIKCASDLARVDKYWMYLARCS